MGTRVARVDADHPDRWMLSGYPPGVDHRVQEEYAVVLAQRVDAANRMAFRSGTCSDGELVIGKPDSRPSPSATESCRASTSTSFAVVLRSSRTPAASRSAMLRCASMRQSRTSPETRNWIPHLEKLGYSSATTSEVRGQPALRHPSARRESRSSPLQPDLARRARSPLEHHVCRVTSPLPIA